jgi:subtilisin family serine protease
VKPHIRIKLRHALAAERLPYWEAAAADARLRTDYFLPAVAQLLARYALPFAATREYRPAGADWSAEERAAGLDRVYRLVLTRNAAIPQALIEQVRLLAEVEEVRAGRIGQAELPSPSATAFSRQTDAASREAIYLDEAHTYGRGSEAITVAVLDTGLDLAHREYRAALRQGYDFVDILDGATEFIGDYIGADGDPSDKEVGHGTHVAGIVAGRGENMPAGVAPRCRLLPVRVLAALQRNGRAVGAGLIENINAGVKWAVDQGAQVINMSLGVCHTGGGLPHEEVIDYAARKGVSVVAASGNDGRNEFYYPGALPSVITVGAADAEGEVAEFSTFGEHVSFIAPGVDVYSSALDGGYAFSTGTSHASPFVAGTVALLKSYARDHGVRLCDRQVKHVLKHTSDKLDRRFKHPKAGYGRINVADAMRYLDSRLTRTRSAPYGNP